MLDAVGDVNIVADQIFALHQDIAEIDADPECQPACFEPFFMNIFNSLLYFYGVGLQPGWRIRR